MFLAQNMLVIACGVFSREISEHGFTDVWNSLATLDMF
jgi:hypothetical protein